MLTDSNLLITVRSTGRGLEMLTHKDTSNYSDLSICVYVRIVWKYTRMDSEESRLT
jgi:hypothetical protein